MVWSKSFVTYSNFVSDFETIVSSVYKNADGDSSLPRISLRASLTVTFIKTTQLVLV